MKFSSRRVVSSVVLLAGFASAVSHSRSLPPARHRRGAVKPKRTESLLISVDGLAELPTADEATAAASDAGLNLDDIQGDVLIGMKKSQELFYFFTINNATAFKPKLASEILPLITTTAQLLDVSTQPVTAVNIAFSQTGLTALGATDAIGDSFFEAGQFADLSNLGDASAANWVPQFAGTSISGVILFASDTVDNINGEVANVEAALGDSITKVYSLQANARPGAEAGHEHFGFLDGISNPSVSGFNSPLPGQAVVAAGTLLLGETGDTVARPAWAKDGTFLVFRQLEQLVPEFNQFLTDHPIVDEAAGLTAQQGSDLLGARMVGRWKSGAPVDLAPLFDNPALGANASANNDFDFTHPGATLAANQTYCPFSAHIRKTRPRADLGTPEDAVHHIMRAGIPYGPEVSDAEAAANTTSTERGLAFVSYQSNIGNGFRFLQKTWADNANFVHSGVGVDPIIGALAGAQRVVSGLDPTDSASTVTLVTDYVVSRGGEYFFTPSLSAISGTLAV